jgi:peptidoglycan/xylan/chitin deacetylase (PgdA/CDA1 family)
MKVGLTIDAVGTLNEFDLILDILKDYNVKATFFGNVNTLPEAFNSICGNGHEIGSHTYSHSSLLSSLSIWEKERDIRSGHLWLMDVLKGEFKDVKIKGFRMPFYNFDPEIPIILERLNYLWDSSKAYFPILGSFLKFERFGEIIELPSLHPDDHTLLRRIGLSENKVLKIWKKSLELSNDVFVWGIHPYICAENKERIQMLKAFLEHVLEKKGVFLTLSEIAYSLSKPT